MTSIWLIAKRELKARALTKGAVISTAVMAGLIIIAGIVVSIWFGPDDDASPDQIGVESSVSALAPLIDEQAGDLGLEFEAVAVDDGGAEAALQDDDADIVAVVGGEPSAPVLYSMDNEPSFEIIGLISGASQVMVLDDVVGELGGDPTDVQQILAGSAPAIEVIADESGGIGSAEFDGEAYFTGILVISLLFYAIILAGQTVAMGVVEEKTSRVVEILLATVRPAPLLAGKILGTAIYALSQLVILTGAIIAGIIISGWGAEFDFPLADFLGWGIIWFFLGFGLFTVLFGGLASLVSRQEEIGTVTTPAMMLLFIPFYAAIFLVPNQPNSLLTEILGYIPFFSPFIMPMRQAFGVDTSDMVIAAAICAVTIPIVVWLAGKIYKRGVLHMGSRMKLKDIFTRSA